MVGFDDGASISFTSWVIAPTYPRKIVKLHPKILSFNPDGSTFGLQAFWKFREQYTLNAIDMKWSLTSENVNFNVNLLKKYGTIRDPHHFHAAAAPNRLEASCFKSAFTPLVDALETRLLQVAFRLSTRQMGFRLGRKRWVSYGIRWWLYGFFHGDFMVIIWDEPWNIVKHMGLNGDLAPKTNNIYGIERWL